jgi:hypothetical protein
MDIQQGVIAFITIAITLSLAGTILGSTAADCSTQNGYDAGTPNNSTGWAKLCVDTELGTQNAFSLTPVILVVLVAVIILAILGLLATSRNQ